MNKFTTPLIRRQYQISLYYQYNQNLPKNLSYKHEEVFLSIIRPSNQNKVIHFPNHLIMERSYNKVLFYFKNMNEEDRFCTMIGKIPTEIFLPNGAVLSVTYTDKVSTKDKNKYIYSYDKVTFTLYIRTR